MDNIHEEKIELMRKYLGRIANGFDYHIKGEIPSKKIDNALKKFAYGMDRKTIIGFYDTTVIGSGKNGYIFTDDKMYYVDTLEKPKKLWYDDIKSMRITDMDKEDKERTLEIIQFDGTETIIKSSFVNKTPLMEFLEEIKNYDASLKQSKMTIKQEKTNNQFAESGGLGVEAYRTVNNQYDEEKFHARQGHGFAAERANTLYDKLKGHDAKIVGDDNAKNGADRIVDGVYIQSKYCATGSRCINECFEEGGKGSFRYMMDGKPMQIEVPSDKYADAIQAMEEKIRNGQVKGVTDPNEAKNIVRKGNFTYAQARNIAKAGTIESLTYDSVNGIITASSAFGVTAIISFATSVWNGEDFDNALKIATYSGLKVGGTAFITSVLAAQLSKAGLNSALVGSSEALVAMMGPKASAVIINAFRSGSKIYGAAAMKSAAKLFRGNAITAGITFMVLSSLDVADIFRGRISGKQLFKNMAGTAATVGGGTGGWIAGAAAGSAILPGVGTVIGGLVGTMAGGSLAGKATNDVIGKFVEDDADEMVEIIESVFTDMASEYLLNNKEAEKAVDKLRDKLTGKVLKEMYASDNRKKFARKLLTPIIENETAKREVIHDPSEEQMLVSIQSVLEEISDTLIEEGYEVALA
ncbi:MAG: hypothetical protein PUH10_00095 [Erysipelotrichaceae bacterium]|uniref:hypothetical protein n=1 Tax=Floccifex sp. TaxID=2815810 RepID=UPI002A759A97|nr:hypothetical protein [Floccifex sp.]MDD7280390.1 hypothetical protein [Erysipelotrichaceae bacterium]MDY2958120.1 hypothetical protein [Floccifex sp.]